MHIDTRTVEFNQRDLKVLICIFAAEGGVSFEDKLGPSNLISWRKSLRTEYSLTFHILQIPIEHSTENCVRTVAQTNYAPAYYNTQLHKIVNQLSKILNYIHLSSSVVEYNMEKVRPAIATGMAFRSELLT